MKNKFKVLFTLILIICLTFSIFGIGKVLASEPVLMLSNVTIEEKSEGVEATLLSFNDDEVKTDIIFHKVDDFVIYRLTIKNTSSDNYKLMLINDNNGSNNIEYVYDYTAGEEIGANSSVDIYVKAIYKTEVTDLTKRVQNQEFKISLITEDEDGNIVDNDIIVNPSTWDNIGIYITTLVISTAFLVLIYIKNKKTKTMIIIALLITPICVNALDPSYTITFIENARLYDKVVLTNIVDGEEVTVAVSYNTVPEKPEDPEVEGYTFDNWYLGDDVYNFDKPLTDDVEIIAKMIPIEYDIQYDLDGGTVNGTNKTKYTIETDSFDLINPEKEGYTFSGWTGSNGDSLQTRLTIEKGSTGNKNYVAHFSPSDGIKYTVVHKYAKLDSDDYDIENEVLTGATETTLTPAFKSKTGFKNPTSQQELTITGDGNAKIEYIYERETYSLTVNDHEYVESNKENGSYPFETVITLKALEKEHYDFTKWSNNSTSNPLSFELTEDTEITPEYSPKQYEISFNANGGVEVNPITKEYNTEIGTLPETAKTDYIFDGWYDEGLTTKVTASDLVTGNVTYYAKWLKSVALAELSTDSITINRLGTETIGVTNVEEEYKFESSNERIATVTEDGLVTGVAKGTTTITITGTTSGQTKTVNVIVNANNYRVTFETNGGSTVEPQDIEENTAINPLPTTEKDNYIFDSWYVDETFTTKVDETTLVTENTTYYAKWLKSVALAELNKESITLTRLDSDNIIASNVDEEYTYTSEDESIATVTETGLVTGVGKGTTTITITGTQSTKTKTVNVTVNPIIYQVTFDVDGGSTVEPQNVEENTAITSLPITEKENYIFDSWYVDETFTTKVDGTTLVTENTTYYAQWKPYFCIPATRLHTETCASDGSCKSDEIAIGATITYGMKPNSTTLSGGFAYSCDVNGDGTYDEETERFYYLTTNEESNNAVLFFYSNFEGSDGIRNVEIFPYEDSLEKLPTTEQWSNAPVTFGDYAGRFASEDELKEACGLTSVRTTGDLKVCNYLLENTKYSSDSTGRSAIWLEKQGTVTPRIHSGNRAVANNGKNSGVRPAIEVPTKFIKECSISDIKYTVTFNTGEGSQVDPIEVIEGEVISNLPVPTLDNYDFAGWYIDETYSTSFTNETPITNNITVYAKWIVNPVAQIGDVKYSTLTEAISDVPTDGTKTTIKLLRDTTESITIDGGKNIEFNLQNYTISHSSKNVIVNNGTIKITNGTIKSTATSFGAINNNQGATLTMTGGSIIVGDGRQAIYNDGGKVTISGDAYLESSSTNRATLQNTNKAGGQMFITGGTIVSINQQAVNNANALTIGEKNGAYDATTPVLQGKTAGLTTSVNVNIYDGIIKGQTKSVDNPSKLTSEEGASVVDTETETISGVEYKLLYYNLVTTKYLITFNANDGTVSPTSKLVDIGDAIGELPTPEKGVYHFDGWYLDSSFSTPATAETVPTKNTILYAKWSYESSDTIEVFNQTNDVMKVYYNNLATWKLDSDSFQTNMQTNFDNYNCKCKDNTCSTAGTVSCDKPNGYDTGFGEQVNVYLSDEETKEKGERVSYTNSNSGVIYNLIPGQTYYWELNSDTDIYGYVKATAEGNRRILETGSVGNTRDLGGMTIDLDEDGTPEGVVKYGKLFRGEKLGTVSSAVTYLEQLGVTEEVDLRAASEISSSEVKLTLDKNYELKHYQIDKERYSSNYNATRTAIKNTMQDVVDGKNIFFHCRIGADRTGTMAYILEGLLGVPEEERLQDYELTVFSGLINRHRYYATDPTSSVSKTEKFVYMYNFMASNEDIYNWYMLGSTDEEADNQLIQNFRTAMIDYYN